MGLLGVGGQGMGRLQGRAIAAGCCLALAVGCLAPMPGPGTHSAASLQAAPALLRYEALADPAMRTITFRSADFRTQAAGVWVRSANAAWNAPTFSFDLLVTNSSGGTLNNVQGVVLSTTPTAPSVTAAGTDGLTGDSLPYYGYGSVASGATGSRNWQFSVPGATPFRFLFTIRAGAGADVGAQKNHAPAVTAVTPAPASIATNASTTVTATASDPNGDALTYSWSAPSGGSISGSGATVTYTAPGATGTYPVNVVVDDGKGATGSGSTNVSVTSGGNGTAQGNVSFGPVPATEVKRAQVAPVAITIDPGDPVTITATGLDNPGNAVATNWYWSQVGTTASVPWLGIFDHGTSGNTASWRTFDGRTDSGTATITARSANNQTASMTVTVREKAPTIASVNPASTCTVARNVPLTFVVVFHDANGNSNAPSAPTLVPNTNHTGIGYGYNDPADLNGDRTYTINVLSFTAAGFKTLSVTQTDTAGNSVTQTWNITIL